MKEPYQSKRIKAINAAAAVFASKGYHGATTQDIANLLGIRQGSLYYYFKSKEEALEEVCYLALKDYVQRIETIARSQASFSEKIHNAIAGHLASYRETSEALKVHNEQRLYLPEHKRERIKRDGSRYREVLENLFREEIAAGGLPENTDCQYFALSVIGLCNSWGAHIVRDKTIDIEHLAQQCSNLFLKGCGYSD
jgi:AcrR family transcriptional regulator